jgi:carboxyl-terminal processing protease
MIGLLAEAAMTALDPYTTMVWPKDVAEFQKVITQEFDGIGVRLNKQGKFLKIAGIIPESPASRTDLEEGEMIVAVNGESTEDMSSNCAVQKISGPRGTTVMLSIQRAGSAETRQVELTRARIIIPTVTATRREGKPSSADPTMIDPANHLGYIRLTSFVETTMPHLEKTLTQLEEQDLKGLILDLRGNAGGLLQTAIEVVDLFVNEGPILQSRSRFIVPSFWNAKRQGTHPGYPLVILIDGGSASASEIVAGALQDAAHRRATLVGSRSFGKGSVQEISHYTGFGSQFKYTTAHYHLPGGQPVKSRYLAERQHTEDWGVRPDVEVKLRRSDRQIADNKDSEDSENPLTIDENTSVEEKQDLLPASVQDDPQLAVALLVLRAKLIQSGQPFQVAIAKDPSSVETKTPSGKSD